MRLTILSILVAVAAATCYPTTASAAFDFLLSEPPAAAAQASSEVQTMMETPVPQGIDGAKAALLFIILAVLIGAATRHFMQRLPVPFTALLLLIGIGLGALTRAGWLNQWGSLDVHMLGDAMTWAAHIDPTMLFFVFLPILIFEAAFAMDLHVFKKSATNSILLAVPGMVVAFLLTGALVYGIDVMNIGLQGWANWSLAFMFGAVISATDPVAVVALLKELGASKKLSTLIEGESLLNDGTGIVLFMVFFLGISGADPNANGFILFAKVGFGGVLVGLIIGAITLRWIKGVFNDAMVEISVVVGVAYLTFFIAEHFFHVSGVLALVTLGLVVGGYGRSSISPHVEHFMKEFWELAGFIANCLIFLIVGLVIAQRTEFHWNDLWALLIVYVGVHLVRATVIAVHYPFMRRSGYGINFKESVILWYGGLRGAIGLALALVVINVDSAVMSKTLGLSIENAEAIKNQFLFLIAGTVVLTLLINATTIKLILQKLGMLELSPAKATMLRQAGEYIRTSTENHLFKLKEDRNLRKANWSAVSEFLPHNEPMRMGTNVITSADQMHEHRRRLLEKEKSSYWRQFQEGMLQPTALRTLTDTVNQLLDEEKLVSLASRKDLEQLWRPPGWLGAMQKTPVLRNLSEAAFFNRLAVSYECAVSFVAAQEDCLSLLQSMARSDAPLAAADLGALEQEVNANIISGQTFTRNLRHQYPEVYRTISTRQAIQAMLNYELHTVQRLQAKGRLDESETARLSHEVEHRMRKLAQQPPSMVLPETTDLLQSIPWLATMPEAPRRELERLFQTRNFAAGKALISTKWDSNGLFVIARGSARVLLGNTLVEVLAKGDVAGELSLFEGRQPAHSVVAETPVTALWLSPSSTARALATNGDFRSLVLQLGAQRRVRNILAASNRYAGADEKQLKRLAMDGTTTEREAGFQLQLNEGQAAVLLSGSCVSTLNSNMKFEAGSMITATEIQFTSKSICWMTQKTVD